MNTSTETVANATETASNAETTKERNDAVDDAVIITSFINAQNRKDEDGNIIGHLGEVAEETGMEMGSLSGRLTSLRKLGVPLPKMGEPGALARTPPTGKTRKKNPADVLALFNKINSELATPSDEDTAKNEVESGDEG